MQLPDEAISYEYQSLLIPTGEEWTAEAELRAKHFLSANRLRDLTQKMMQVRSQVLAERELKETEDHQPLDAGFIDLPQRLLDQYRRKGVASTLGQILERAAKLREDVDHVIILGIGGSYMGARALFEALRHRYHNLLPPDKRLGVPRVYFEGNNVDNDSCHELMELLQDVCVDPDIREERWGVVVISKSGGTMETAAALRAFKREAEEYYGLHSPLIKQLIVPITGQAGKLRDLCLKEGYDDKDILTIPDNVGGRYSVFTPVGLLPAAAMDLDVRALLLGAATMTKRFTDEPFEQNPVLRFAAVNYLMAQECGKHTRVFSIWSKKLEAVGLWYDQLLSESLGKLGRGPTPITAVQTRDLHSRGQQHQEGTRDKVINNLIVKNCKHPPIMIGMRDDNEDDLNQYNRQGYPDMMDAAHRGTNKAYFDVARPTADLIMPTLSEHTMGQLLQMLMLATVVEGHLMGINPYGQPGVEAYKRNMKALLKQDPDANK